MSMREEMLHRAEGMRKADPDLLAAVVARQRQHPLPLRNEKMQVLFRHRCGVVYATNGLDNLPTLWGMRCHGGCQEEDWDAKAGPEEWEQLFQPTPPEGGAA